MIGAQAGVIRVAVATIAGISLSASALTATDAAPPPAAPAYDDTVAANLTPAGTSGDGESAMPSVSRDGRYLLFYSESTDISSPATTGDQVFRRDLLTDTTVLVSVTASGAPGDAGSYPLGLSADGRYAAFTSEADDLVAGDTNGYADTFVRDLATGTTTRVSVATDGTQADGDSHELDLWGYPGAISADGRWVVFTSNAHNLASGVVAPGSNVYRHDLRTGETELVSDLPESSDNFTAAISDDGRYIAYANWVNHYSDSAVTDHTGYAVFRRDMQSGDTALVSTPLTGTTAGYYVFDPSISADGDLVAFSSDATNLIAGDVREPANTGHVLDIFVRRMSTGTTELGATANGGGQLPEGSSVGAISADGTHLAFISPSASVVAGDGNGAPDVFVRDLSTDAVTRVSVAADGSESPTGSDRYTDSDLSLSGDASVVAYESDSALVAGAPSGTWNVYARLTAVEPVITSATPPAPVVGTAYAFPITATGTGPLRYAVTGGALPAGIVLDSRTGLLSGTTDATGDVAFAVTVTGAGGTASAAYAFHIVAPDAVQTPAPAPTDSAPARVRFVVRTTSGYHVGGTRTTVAISKLAPGERFTVRLGGAQVATGVAGPSGTARVRVRIPASVSDGAHSLRVIGSAANRAGITKIATLDPTRHLTITTAPANLVGANYGIRIRVSGLAAHEPVVVRFHGSRISPASARADAHGRYTLTVPAGWSWGVKKISARGLAAHRIGRSSITVGSRTIGRGASAR